ncbi:MAG: DUF1599 domain-containing protein [Desulfurellales bacterium]|nr:MAG: DUF1599 domain-containing protein [Desulfurellales bacterium]
MDSKRYRELVLPAMEMVVKKGEDYNAGPQLHDYFPFGDASYIQMVFLKAQRLVSLQMKEGAPNYEGIKDTLLDLINYIVFYLDYLDQE